VANADVASLSHTSRFAVAQRCFCNSPSQPLFWDSELCNAVRPDDELAGALEGLGVERRVASADSTYRRARAPAHVCDCASVRVFVGASLCVFVCALARVRVFIPWGEN
jgi:hypothetical protein